jgi:beta-glucosidase
VLVRNENYALPLEAAALSRVAVIGALAQDARILGGGSAQVTPPYAISPLDGLSRALSGIDVAYAVGADPRPFLPAAHEFGVDTTAVRWIGDVSLAPRTVAPPSRARTSFLNVSMPCGAIRSLR